jgi:hypothetical protein
MLIICDGMPRSASTWSFNVVLNMLRSSQPIREVYGDYDEDIARFLDSIPSTATHGVVKCHKLDFHGRALALSGTAKAIYTWRDPADAVVSCMRMFDYDFERSLSAVDSSLELYHFHRRETDALILDYERIVSATIEAVRDIAVFLGLDDQADLISAVAEQTSLARAKESSESLTADRRLIRDTGLEYDRETLLHRGHIQNGSAGYGRKALSIEQAEQIDELLRRHGIA